MQGHQATENAELVPQLYGEMRRIAGALLQSERRDHAFHATDLVHEAYVRLCEPAAPAAWRDSGHFLGAATNAMRRVLVDHARRKQAGKRIPAQAIVALDLIDEPATVQENELSALKEALNRLAEVDPRQAQVVELRYFRGLTESETAEALEVSRPTVSRAWRTAKLWLQREISR